MLAWAQVLGKVAGREDVVFGTCDAGAHARGEGAERVMGLFINTLAGADPGGGRGSRRPVCERVHRQLAELLRHDMPRWRWRSGAAGVPAS